MAANAKKEGVKTLGKGVQYKVIKEGTGKVPTDKSIVTIKYEGKNIEGKVFDKNDNAKMAVAGAVPGFTEALTHMPVGSTWEIYIPHTAGYGARQVSPDLKPFSTMIFTVTLLSAEDMPQPQMAPQAPQAQAQPKQK
jgi:FKBP-type peptidyl-prolyl cis-trans isomerase FklB